MKFKLMHHQCLDEECGYSETSHKAGDAKRCSRCGSRFVASKYVDKHSESECVSS